MTTLDTTSELKPKDLRQLYPAVFGANIRPLRIGIYHDLLRAHQGALTKRTLYALLGPLTNRPAYLAAIAAGGPRYALDGTVAGEISDVEKKMATDRLQSLRIKVLEQQLEEKQRSESLKAFEASGLSLKQYAESIALDINVVERSHTIARNERRKRQEKRLALVEAFEKSGLSIEEFSARSGKSIPKIKKAMEKSNEG